MKSKKVKKDIASETLYVGKKGTRGRVIFDKFVDNCLLRGLKVSPSVLQLLDAENQRLAGLNGEEIKPKFDYVSKKEKRLKLKKTEFRLQKLLNFYLPNHRHCFEVLCNFAGTDRGFTEQPEKALQKAIAHRYDGSEPFGPSDLENFIEYLEIVLQRRKLEEELIKYRRQNNKSND